ncbi:MAG: TetR/AcrR family transcriptional regulator [Clostridia bacterium]|nr:TetR/AcrR family transcriptional regulator [Clostridia bacterium]
MERKNAAHEVVVESMTEALLLLMQQKPLAEITISELCEKAGVSRISFYRNFASADDILIQHLTACTNNWWKSYSRRTEEDFYRNFWSELLAEYRKNRELILLIYRNGRSHIIKEHIFACCSVQTAADEREAYLRAALAGALYGLVDEWIRRGMGTLPKDFSLHDLRFEKPEEQA